MICTLATLYRTFFDLPIISLWLFFIFSGRTSSSAFSKLPSETSMKTVTSRDGRGSKSLRALSDVEISIVENVTSKKIILSAAHHLYYVLFPLHSFYTFM